jgi:hypothetical protein
MATRPIPIPGAHPQQTVQELAARLNHSPGPGALPQKTFFTLKEQLLGKLKAGTLQETDRINILSTLRAFNIPSE